MTRTNRPPWLPLSVIGLFLLMAQSASARDIRNHNSTLKHLTKISTLSSTVPENGDINPYGIALVQKSVGNLIEGHILISNFNASSNAQGTGTTIVDVAPDGTL